MIVNAPAPVVSHLDDIGNGTSGNAMQKNILEFGVILGSIKNPTA